MHTDRTVAGLLVARGFDLNVPIRDQETPLTRACRANKGEHPAAVAALHLATGQRVWLTAKATEVLAYPDPGRAPLVL